MLNVDATLLRLLVVITTFFSGGTVIFIYIIASLVIPKEPVYDPPMGGPYRDPYAGGHQHGGPRHGHYHTEEKKSNIDEVMKDIERKAMQREIEELKAKLASVENNNKAKGDV